MRSGDPTTTGPSSRHKMRPACPTSKSLPTIAPSRGPICGADFRRTLATCSPHASASAKSMLLPPYSARRLLRACARNRYVACPLVTFRQYRCIVRFRLVFDLGSPRGPSRPILVHASYCTAGLRPPVWCKGRYGQASLATLASTGERRRIRAEALPLCTVSYTGAAAPRSCRRGDFGEVLPMSVAPYQDNQLLAA